VDVGKHYRVLSPRELSAALSSAVLLLNREEAIAALSHHISGIEEGLFTAIRPNTSDLHDDLPIWRIMYRPTFKGAQRACASEKKQNRQQEERALHFAQRQR